MSPQSSTASFDRFDPFAAAFGTREKVVKRGSLTPHKGKVPRHAYVASFQAVYQYTTSLTFLQAYRVVRKQFQIAIDAQRGLGLNKCSPELPVTCSCAKAKQIIHKLLFPTIKPEAGTFQNGTNLLFGDALPWKIADGSLRTIQTFFGWIDTNVKLALEQLNLLDTNSKELLANTVFTIYSVILKADNYQLARQIGTNHCMFHQDRLVQSVLGPELAKLLEVRLVLNGQRLNDLAAKFIEKHPPVSLLALCEASVYSGVVWPDDVLIQSKTEFLAKQLSGAALIRWRRDDRQRFLDAALAGSVKAVFVLDDNWESVFDLVLIQWLLLLNSSLTVFIVVNRRIVDNNLHVDELQRLLRSKRILKWLRNFWEARRLRLVIEEQPFRSFMVEWLKPKTLTALKQSELLFIKGSAFSESFQPGFERFHAFCIQSWTAQSLMGAGAGTGVFAFCYRNQSLEGALTN